MGRIKWSEETKAPSVSAPKGGGRVDWSKVTQPTPQPQQLSTQPNQRQPIVAPLQQKVTAGAVAREIPGAIREVGVGTLNAIIRPFQRAGLNIYRTSEGIATLGAYTALKKAGKLQEANKLLQDFNKKVNTGKIAALDPKTGKPMLEESKPVTGPVEAAGVGADIGLTLAGPMVGKALGRVNVGRKGFTITKPVAKVLATERPEKAVDVLRSVESRMERSSPQGKKIVGLVKESDSRFLPNVGKRVMELQDAKLNKVKNPLDITDALEGRIKPESLKPDQKKIFDVVDQIRKSVAERSQKVGLEIRTSGGGKVPFKPRENYFPHTIPNESQLSKGVVRKEVIAGAVKRGDFKTVAEATDALDKYVQFTKSGGKDHLDFFAKRLIEQEAKKASGQVDATDAYRSTGAMREITDEQSAFGPGRYLTKDKGVAKMYTDVAGGNVVSEKLGVDPKKVLNLSRQSDLDEFTKQAIKKYPLGAGKTGESIQRLAKDLGYEAIDGDEITGTLVLKRQPTTNPLLTEARYKIIKKYAGSKPVGTILNEKEMTLTPKLYPEYFQKVSPNTTINLSAEVRNLDKAKQAILESPTLTAQERATVQSAKSFDEVWNIVKTQGPDTQGMFLTRLQTSFENAPKTTTPTNPLLAEARKYKSAEEFANGIKKNPVTLNIKDLELSHPVPGNRGPNTTKGPIEVFYDTSTGKFMVEDGNKRVMNAADSGKKTIDAIVTPIGMEKTLADGTLLPKEQWYPGVMDKSQLTSIWEEAAKAGSAKPPLSLAEARGRVLRYFKASRQQRYGNLERAREIDLPFYDPNPKRVLPKYLASTERRLADAEVLGPNLEKVDQLLGTIKNPDVQDLMRRMVKVIRPGANQGEQLAGKALDFTRGISTTRLSPLSGITNLGQSSNSYLASDAKSFLKGFTKAIFTKEGRRLPIESGNLAESVLRAIQQQAGGDSRLVGGYLKAIGFTQTEQLNRRIASNVGAEYGKSLYQKLLKNPTNKLIRSELQDLELNPDDLLKTGFNKDSVLRAAKVFTDRTQFRSREIDLPSIATTTPIGKNLAQFKTFAFQQSRFISKQTIGQLKTNPRRALRNIAILATVYPLTGEAIADLRSMISGKERTTRGIERYIEDAAQVGAFGIIYDAVKSASFEGGVGKFLLGPTLSGILDNIDLTKKSLDKGFSDAEKRDYIRQIPGVGPVAATRLLPPEKKEENKNTGSGKEIVKDSGFGETTIPKPTFRVDGKNVGLKPAQAKEYQAEVVRAYTDSLAEASKLPGWNEKDNAGKKKEFDKIFNKKKIAIQQKWLDTGKLNPNTIAGENRLTEGPADPFRVAANYGKGFLTDPEQTLKALFTKERLRDVVGPIGKGVVRLERQKFLSLLDKGDKGKVIDHIIPLTLGGTNDPSNLRVVPEELNKEKAKEEVRLLNLVKQGKMTRKQAQEEIRKFR